MDHCDQPASCVTVTLAPHFLLYSTTLRTWAPVISEVMCEVGSKSRPHTVLFVGKKRHALILC